MATDFMAELVAQASKLPADKLREVVEYVRAIGPAADPTPPPRPREPVVLVEGGLANYGPLPPTELLNEWRREAWMYHPSFRPDDLDWPGRPPEGDS